MTTATETKKVVVKAQRKPLGRMHVLLKASKPYLPPEARLARDGGPYTLQGGTDNFKVYFENSLGAQGPTLADGVLASCEREYAQLQDWFGGLTPGGLPFTIYVVTGDFGAYHATCGATEFHCAAFDGTDVDLVRMLVVAEEVEVFEDAQGVGWDCGASHGEGLSRVLATELYPAELDGFATASAWLNTPDRPDFVNHTDPSDTNFISIGCAVLFLNYLRYQLNFSWKDIIAAGAPTLAETYTKLTGRTDGWDQFAALLQAKFPIGTPVTLPNDNPFPLSPAAVGRPHQRGRNGANGHGVARLGERAYLGNGDGLLIGSSSLAPEIVQERRVDTKGPRGPMAALVTQYGYNQVGPSSGDVILKSTGWNISESPTVVLCQARQMDNIDHGWPDQFCIQVIETAPDFVRIRIRRIDAGTGGSGWGQNLRVDTIVIN